MDLSTINNFIGALGTLGGWLANPVRILKMIAGLAMLVVAGLLTIMPEAAGAVTAAASGSPGAGMAVEQTLRGKPRQGARTAIHTAATGHRQQQAERKRKAEKAAKAAKPKVAPKAKADEGEPVYADGHRIGRMRGGKLERDQA